MDMKIKIINPDLNEGISASMQKRALRYVGSSTVVDCCSPSYGVRSVDDMFTWNIAAVSVVDELLKSEKEEEYDAYVIACFWNPGLYACRELTKKPVVGIGQASLLISQLIGEKIALICVGGGREYIYRDDIIRSGLQDKIVALKTVDIVSEDSFANPQETQACIIEAAKETIEKDHADVLILGCGVMAEFAGAVEAATGVPVVNPLGAGVKLAESLVSMKLTNSKRFSYQYPTGAELINIKGRLNQRGGGNE